MTLLDLLLNGSTYLATLGAQVYCAATSAKAATLSIEEEPSLAITTATGALSTTLNNIEVPDYVASLQETRAIVEVMDTDQLAAACQKIDGIQFDFEPSDRDKKVLKIGQKQQ